MNYTILFHPEVRTDLEAIAQRLAVIAGREVAQAKLAEIEATVRTLAQTPHKGTIRDEIAPGLRAIPAGRRGVIAFVVDDASRQVRVYAVSYGGDNWIGRMAGRS